MWYLGAADRHESEDVVPGTTLWQNTEMQKKKKKYSPDKNEISYHLKLVSKNMIIRRTIIIIIVFISKLIFFFHSYFSSDPC